MACYVILIFVEFFRFFMNILLNSYRMLVVDKIKVFYET